MNRSPAIPLSLVLLFAFLPLAPASAITPAGFDCGPDDGREQLTADGFTLEFDAPDVLAPELAATREQTGDGITRQRSAHFYFRANRWADLDLTLDWTAPNNDFDLYAFDADGFELARSDNSNIDGQTIGELATVSGIRHCDDFSVEVRNWAGDPGEPLTLEIELTNPGPMFACEEDDPHPACEGKEAGEPPARVDDTRTRVYLGGEGPGNVGAASHYADSLAGAGTTPGSTTMSTERPLGGRTNTYTHVFQGNPDNGPNPFQGNWILPLDEALEVSGDVHVQLWISSQSQSGGPNGKLNIDLYTDSFGAGLGATRVARVVVPGSQIPTIASPLFVTFEDVSFSAEQELILQVAADAVVTSAGAVQATEDLEFTVYYDSVQFPSQVTLPEGALL